ncbi:hypothetical protein Cpin_1291 [Chitinophaga pinensis DSM 2588]|uniref:Uncharacterized protein n=2 Tax=Chitinophaga pinensis TaxID=79329 RepID=A0A979GRJ3_CHIPD|nr:hypothetical protein Cpin_1291 [Chitinophaga pinensis DSM 2588]
MNYILFLPEQSPIPMSRIPVGIRHFTRRALSKEEAGCIDAMPGALQLEYVQYYFHICQIPVLPTKAGWYARNKENVIEKLPEDIAAQLNAIYHPRVSLWACLGPLMLITVVALAFLVKGLAAYYTEKHIL